MKTMKRREHKKKLSSADWAAEREFRQMQYEVQMIMEGKPENIIPRYDRELYKRAPVTNFMELIDRAEFPVP